jgi:hypothetical protein
MKSNFWLRNLIALSNCIRWLRALHKAPSAPLIALILPDRVTILD